MRAVLILLGVVYHAAQPYESQAWIVTDPSSTRVLAWVAFALQQFRMPGFFMLSGFLGAVAYQKYGARAFLARRVLRLGIPLAFGLLVINTAQNALIAWLHRTHCSTPAPCVRVSHAFSVSHLWFLIYLLLFVVALPLVFEALRSVMLRVRSRRPKMRSGQAAPVTFGLIALAACIAILHGVAHWVDALYEDWWGFFVPYDALRMFGWFALGIGCALSAAHTDAWFRRHPPRHVTFASLALGLLVCATLAGFFTEVAGSALNVAAESAATLGTGMLLFGSMHLLGGLYELSPAWFSKLSDASYTIYLVHHPIVVALAGSMLGLRLSPFAKFGLIVAVTGAASYLFHTAIVRKLPWLRLALNGTRARG